VAYNKKLEESGEASVQRMIGEHTLPEVSIIKEDIEIIWDAPEWWYTMKGKQRQKDKIHNKR
jgi:hypothetical protein